MNDTQRKFLINEVENTFIRQKEKLEKQIPDRPRLGHYILAAFLDNTIKLNDTATIRKKMRDMVLESGSVDDIIGSGDGYGRRRNRRSWDDDDDDSADEVVKVPAEELFVIPEDYKKAVEKYEKKKEEVRKKIEQLEAHKKTIVLKVQIGSNAILDKLVAQVDNMGDLDLINSQLLLTDVSGHLIEDEPTSKKKLPSSKKS